MTRGYRNGWHSSSLDSSREFYCWLNFYFSKKKNSDNY